MSNKKKKKHNEEKWWFRTIRIQLHCIFPGSINAALRCQLRQYHIKSLTTILSSLWLTLFVSQRKCLLQTASGFFIETFSLHKRTIPPLTTNFHSFSVPAFFMSEHLQLLIKFSYYFFLFSSSDHFFEWLSTSPCCLQHSFNFLVRPRLISDTVTNYNFLSFGISLEMTSWTEPQFLCSCFLRRYVAKKYERHRFWMFNFVSKTDLLKRFNLTAEYYFFTRS